MTYWSFPDALIQTYTLPYVFQIKEQLPPDSKLYLFTLSPENYKKDHPVRHQIEMLKKKGIVVLNFKYTPFGITMAMKMVYILCYLRVFSVRYKISHIHSWCTPGGAIGYLASLLSGKKLILDSFEPHALAMLESRAWKKNSFAFKFLFLAEKLQYKKADYVITAAPGMDRHAEQVYGVNRRDCFVKPACVDLNAFRLSMKKNGALVRELDLENTITCVYAGKFGGLYLERETFDFFKIARDYFGKTFRVLLLSNHSEEEIQDYCGASGLDRKVIIRKFVSHAQIPLYLGTADFAITPVKPVPTKQYCTPIKNGEYWAMGLPVVITKNISTDSRIIEQNQIGYVLQELSAAEYLNAAKQIAALLKEPGLAVRIRTVAERERSFSIAEKVYRSIYGPFSP